jgi:hypothetical protein
MLTPVLTTYAHPVTNDASALALNGKSPEPRPTALFLFAPNGAGVFCACAQRYGRSHSRSKAPVFRRAHAQRRRRFLHSRPTALSLLRSCPMAPAPSALDAFSELRWRLHARALLACAVQRFRRPCPISFFYYSPSNMHSALAPNGAYCIRTCVRQRITYLRTLCRSFPPSSVDFSSLVPVGEASASLVILHTCNHHPLPPPCDRAKRPGCNITAVGRG